MLLGKVFTVIVQKSYIVDCNAYLNYAAPVFCLYNQELKREIVMTT
jgi:hypothetical protein